MREDILQLLQTSREKPTSIEVLKKALAIKTKDSFTMLIKTLNELDEEGLIVTTEKNDYLLLEYSNYLKGTLRVNRKGYGFVDAQEGSVYIHEKYLSGALDKDEVIAKTWTNSDGSIEGSIYRILNNNLKTIVGNMRYKYGRLVFIPDNDTISQHVKLANIDDYNLVDGHKIVCRITSYGKTITAQITEVLGHVNDPGVDIQGILLSHDISAEFPAEVIEQTQAISSTISEEDKIGRTDLTKQIVITIDGDDAKDLDDAISITRLDNGFRLAVHIADVSHYVQERTALDIEAYNRSTSVYVVDRVVPMLPHALSNGICSLIPYEERLTITCEMDFDNEGIITNYQLYPSIIKSTERMTYNNVNKILDGDYKLIEKYKPIYSNIITMAQLSELIQAKRYAKGAIDFDKEEAKIELDKKGNIIRISPRERLFAERMIENFMVSANECVAKHMKWLEFPCVYRVHEEPPAKKMREFIGISKVLGFNWSSGLQKVYPKQLQTLLENAKGTDSFPVISSMMLRSMSKAKYDPSCIGHFGLALDEYLHFTSPIRRYPDLVVHRMLRKYGFNQCIDTNQLENDILLMKDIAQQTSSMERNAVDAEREVEDMKKAEYMEKQVGNIYEGIISGVTNFGLFVELPNTVEGLIHISEMRDDYYHFMPTTFSLVGERAGKKFTLGQKIMVQCIKANRYQKSVDFIIASSNSKQQKNGTTSTKKDIGLIIARKEKYHGKSNRRKSKS